MAVGAGQDRRAARRAQRVRAEAGVQPGALPGQAVDARSLVDHAAVRPDGMGGVIITDEDQHVGPSRHRRPRWSSRQRRIDGIGGGTLPSHPARGTARYANGTTAAPEPRAGRRLPK